MPSSLWTWQHLYRSEMHVALLFCARVHVRRSGGGSGVCVERWGAGGSQPRALAVPGSTPGTAIKTRLVVTFPGCLPRGPTPLGEEEPQSGPWVPPVPASAPSFLPPPPTQLAS